MQDPLYDDQDNFNANLRSIWKANYQPHTTFIEVGVFHPAEVLLAIKSVDPKKRPGPFVAEYHGISRTRS